MGIFKDTVRYKLRFQGGSLFRAALIKSGGAVGFDTAPRRRQATVNVALASTGSERRRL